MDKLAEEYNACGIAYEEDGQPELAEGQYRKAIEQCPEWPAPWFNLGLLCKRQRRWRVSFECNQRAVELDPSDEAGWWNLGIAATALGWWSEARRAWAGIGLNVSPGNDPPELGLGSTPIRINLGGVPEVVWCSRMDPARAVIQSVPLAGSNHRFLDLVLHDGAPNGYRRVGDLDVPVFDELCVLSSSTYGTFRALIVSSASDFDDLAEMAAGRDIGTDDWSHIRSLCKACGEGEPFESHEHFHDTSCSDLDELELGIAAKSDSEVEGLLAEWLATHRDCEVIQVERLIDPVLIN